MNITLWKQDIYGHWQTTNLLLGDMIIVHVRDHETIFVYQRGRRRLAVKVDDQGHAYDELVVPAYCTQLQTLQDSLNNGLRCLGLHVQLYEVAPLATGGHGEFKSAAFFVRSS